MNENFAQMMYQRRYEKRLGVELYALGFKTPAEKTISLVLLSREEMTTFAHAEFEDLSDANNAFKAKIGVKKKNGKHLRMHVSAKEVNNYALRTGLARWEFTLDEFEEALDIVQKVKNQRNKGYALERMILGENWNPKKRGVDIDKFHIEVKYMNGQFEL